jgi:hypothetical protein
VRRGGPLHLAAQMVARILIATAAIDQAVSQDTVTQMHNEKITVRVTATGNTLEVVVLSKRAESIEVVLGEGVHSVRCQLSPTRNGMAYAGSALGREIVYERGRAEVNADLRAEATRDNFSRR